MMLQSFGQVCATMLHSGKCTSSICNTKHDATRCNSVAKCAYELRMSCDRLAGACKCWASNVEICSVEMLRSFGRDLSSP